jgi:hypothetical protein
MKVIIKILIVITLFCFSESSLLALDGNGCAETEVGGCTNGWNHQDLSYTIPDTDCKITCSYWFRICNGVFQWQYENVSATGNCAFMQNFNYLHYSFSSVNELLDILILADFNNNNEIGECPSNYTTAMFYSASCGIWLSCEYDIAPQTPRCEQGYDDVPAPGPTTVKTWKWQACGTTCCKRTYTICKQLDAVTNTTIIKINAMTKSKIGNCTQEPGGSAPKYARPCEDGC